MKFWVILTLIVAFNLIEAKRGGGGSFGRGSSSRGSSSSSRGSSSGGGWFGSSKPSPSYTSYSKPAPSPSRPSPSSYSYPSPSYNSKPATSYSNPPGGSTGYGWNVGNTAPKPAAPASTNYGWNVAPPSYPGLQNKPVQSVNKPPAYSPSYSNPPAYSANVPRQPAYNPSYTNTGNIPKQSYSPSYSSNPGYIHSSANNPTYQARPNYNYGNTFGSGGLPGNTYISNNYYGGSPYRSSGFGGFGGGYSHGGSGYATPLLTHALVGYGGYKLGQYSSRSHSYYHDDYYRRRDDSYYREREQRDRESRWREEDERNWRATTKAPYFENKVPGSESYLPAAAVVGAATAFGLVSLLPLNVPANKPLMYCNATGDVNQTPIKIGDVIYACSNKTVLKSCPQAMENGTIVDPCFDANQTLICDLNTPQYSLFCTNGTMLSAHAMVCNSTIEVKTPNSNETSTVLYCYHGELSERLAGSIPTTTTTTERPPEPKPGYIARVHLFFLNLFGKGDKFIKETNTTTTTEAPYVGPIWIPEPLTIPPPPLENETTTLETITESDLKNLALTTELPTVNSTSKTIDSPANEHHNDEEDDYFEKTTTTAKA